MLGTRHDEYQSENNSPFSLQFGIYRSSDIRSEDANWHENIEIQLCTEGEGYVILDGNMHSIKPGDVTVISANVIHYTGTETEIKYDCLIIDSKFFPWFLAIIIFLIQYQPCFRLNDLFS